MTKPVKGYEGLYEITDSGTVYSLNYRRSGVRRRLLPDINSRGYLYVQLFKDKTSKLMRIHRLVAMAFVPNSKNLPYVNHKNGNQKDNRSKNLEWCTPSGNGMHACRVLGKWFGILSPVEQYDRDGNFIAQFKSQMEASRVTGINNSSIGKAANGQATMAGDFIWKRAKDAK